jgi:hypothetical protein
MYAFAPEKSLLLVYRNFYLAIPRLFTKPSGINEDGPSCYKNRTLTQSRKDAGKAGLDEKEICFVALETVCLCDFV